MIRRPLPSRSAAAAPPRVLRLACLLCALSAAAGALAVDLPEPVAAGHLDLEGGRLYHEVFGAGFPIVLIHDGLAHREVWDAQVADLARDYRVVRYDRRGYGLSDAPEAPFSNVDDLEALLAALAIERAVLIGSSAGGGLCLDYALDHPERVEALVLAGPVVGGLSYSYHFWKRGYANFGETLEENIDLWTADEYSIAPGNDAARARLREILEACPHDLDFSRGRFELGPRRPALYRLGEIRVPTLIVSAEHDIPDVHAHVGAIEAGIAGARRVVLDDAGHLSYLEQPEAFDAEVREFLSLIGLEPGSPLLDPDPPAPWDTFARGFAPVPGSALYYESMGEGEPVVLIHGGAVDHRMWRREFADLARDHRVIRLDVRGQGLSQNPAGAYCSYEDLGLLLDHLDIPRAHLVGLSLGGRIAVDFALANPERVISLVAVAPGLSGYPFETPEDQAYLQKVRAAWMAGDWAQAAEEFVRAWCDGPRRSPDETDPDVRRLVKAMALETMRPDRYAGGGRELDPPAVDRLAELSVPTLAIVGELDMPSIHEIVGMIADRVPGARRVDVPGVAHMVNLERPGRFGEILRGFLAERASR
jgi:3-oxoadipate enol-lactonase